MSTLPERLYTRRVMSSTMIYDGTGHSVARVQTPIISPHNDDAVAAEIVRRYNAHDDLIALLSALEWSGAGERADDNPWPMCPICEALKPNISNSTHADGCRLAALLDAEKVSADA